MPQKLEQTSNCRNLENHSSSKDEALFRSWMEQYRREVWSYAYGLTHKHDVADDITQDVFLKAYRRIASFRGDGSVRAWLLTITRNTVLDYQRSPYFRKVTVMDRIETEKAHTSAEEEYLKREDSREMFGKILEMPLPFRDVLLLKAKYEMKPGEIASFLKLPLTTIKTRLHRARKEAVRRLQVEGRP
ncbi:RNA polymerase sigma factor [Paenibacillus sp. MZ04-78.2]|uniref:RNA polymerase sigma factor n=1 Tax=Paenibacillus sp. MZ04-78.2 TaxID=2962034 RepID=UPI0020B81A07|nr:RNA polymerase sigma factor [Paenibacillus sp. MZ04-78.2]MCP3773419.1 RNA polymerase sigma factor [Paenibacillus sp. MZ04-78.2]